MRLALATVAATFALAGLAVATAERSAAQPVQPAAVAPREPGRTSWVSADQVRVMQQAAAAYRALAARGGWPLLPEGTTLRAGDKGANVEILQRRLATSGDLSGAATGIFDGGLESAVRRFQQRHGLPTTGVVHDLTRRALNVTAEVRAAQIEANLARVVELLPKLATTRRYLLMNAASFELQGLTDGRVEVASRTIVGKRATPTPAISARVDAINLLPYWHVPGGIARRAVIPAIRKDPAYLYKERIRVFSNYGGEEINPSEVNWWGPEAERYMFRQDPGPHNALGVIRFDMPNKYVVYLHDTPAKPLYQKFERTFSSGCVRTQSYLDVAEWALAGQGGWSRADIERGIAAGRSRTIKLATPIPIHLIYLTAWVEDGAVQFRNDVYGRDKIVVDRGRDAALNTWVTTVGP